MHNESTNRHGSAVRFLCVQNIFCNENANLYNRTCKTTRQQFSSPKDIFPQHFQALSRKALNPNYWVSHFNEKGKGANQVGILLIYLNEYRVCYLWLHIFSPSGPQQEHLWTTEYWRSQVRRDGKPSRTSLLQLRKFQDDFGLRE